MAYLGRRGTLAPLTSADIPAGIVEGTDVAFLENSSGQTLAGTYSTERMYLSGRTGSAPNDYNYKLEGNVTVTGHLALGSIADEDIIITNDGTERTITTDASGGTLEAGNVLQDTHRTSLTDMTGVLGSVVTGSPNLNLGNATFPSGCVVRTETNTTTTETNCASSSANAYTSITNANVTITPRYANSKIIIYFYGGGMVLFASNAIQVKVTGTTTGTILESGRHGYYSHTNSEWVPVPFFIQAIDTPGTVTTQTYQLHIATSLTTSSSDKLRFNSGQGANYNSATITAMEIKV